MKAKITKTMVDKIIYSSKPMFYYDVDLTGFGIKVGATKATYFAETRVDGKTVRKKVGLVNVISPDKARRDARVLLGTMSGGVNPNLKEKEDIIRRKTLQEAFEDYQVTKNITEKTVKEYKRAMRITFEDWANKPLTSLNRDMVEAKFKEVSSRTRSIANSDFRFLRALINFAMEKYAVNGDPLIPSNPCNRLTALKLWNKIERRTTYISPQKLPAFFTGLKTSENDTDIVRMAKNQCMFIIFTGCREQEAARLKWKDVDLKEQMVTFHITKNHNKHILPMGEWLTAFIKSLYKGQSEDSYIFPANNKSGHLQDHRKYIKDISNASGVDFSLHDIRRTFASIINHHLGSSFTPYTIKRLLNHSNQDVTGGYIQFGIEDLRRPIQMIEDFLLENGGLSEKSKNTVVKFEKKQSV